MPLKGSCGGLGQLGLQAHNPLRLGLTLSIGNLQLLLEGGIGLPSRGQGSPLNSITSLQMSSRDFLTISGLVDTLRSPKASHAPRRATASIPATSTAATPAAAESKAVAVGLGTFRGLQGCRSLQQAHHEHASVPSPQVFSPVSSPTIGLDGQTLFMGDMLSPQNFATP